MSLPRRIVLVGFMGAGKTTVGALLAEKLGLRFLDLDVLIEARLGVSVAEIFAARGEAGFREEERRQAHALAGVDGCVVATGGGAWAEAATRAVLQDGALSVWLDADIDTLLARLPADGSRPLASSRERMRALLEQRRSAYALANLRVDARPAPEVVARGIQAALTGAGGPHRRPSDEER